MTLAVLLIVLATAFGQVGTPLIAGRANYANPSHGSNYLAMRLERGTVVRITGAGGSWTTRTTDYGPAKRTGDIADIALVQFARLCDYLRPPRYEGDDRLWFARRMGECDVEVEILGDIRLPATDMEE